MTTPPPIPPISYAYPQPVALPFRDQRGGLRGWGVVLIVIGVIAVLFTLMIPVTVLSTRGMVRSSVAGAPPPPDLRTLVPGILMYALAAVFFLWVGIASVRLQRWVRPIMLVTCWPWLVAGFVGLIWWIILSPKFTQAMGRAGSAGPAAAMPPGMTTMVLVFMGTCMGVILVVLPGLFVWFYGNTHVSATLYYFDQQPSWTDRVPVPILGISMWLVLTAMSCVIGLFAPAVSMFGTILSGPAAVGVLLLLALIALVLARETFRQRAAAWWGTIAMVVLCTVSVVVTHLGHSASDFLEKSGATAEQLSFAKSMDRSVMLESDLLWGVVVVIAIAYLIYARRFYKPAAAERVMTPEDPPVFQ